MRGITSLMSSKHLMQNQAPTISTPLYQCLCFFIRAQLLGVQHTADISRYQSKVDIESVRLKHTLVKSSYADLNVHIKSEHSMQPLAMAGSGFLSRSIGQCLVAITISSVAEPN